jgi:phospholipid/cholesterol/gamma-HCH transport system substrate-binding protein
MMARFSAQWSRTAVLAGFFAIGVTIVAYIYINVGGYVPFLYERTYTVSVQLSDVDNLVTADRVSSAGMQIGAVRSSHRVPGGINVELTIDHAYAPLHTGVRIRLGERSLVGETCFDLTEGTGAPLPSGSRLPLTTAQPSVQLRDVLASMDTATRQALGSMIRSVGVGTDGGQPAVNQLFTGLGGFGRGGAIALDAISAQSDDLRQLGGNTTTLLNALDGGEGELVTLVHNADQLTHATADQQRAVAATIRELPATLDSARTASGPLRDLSHALSPVAAKLRDSAPPLSEALTALPEVSANLRNLVPALDKTVDRAPTMLRRTPRFSTDVRSFIPPAQEALRDVDPALGYIKPYGLDLAAFLANFGATFANTDERGLNYVRLMPTADARSVQSPLAAGSVVPYLNPFPKPGSLPNPGPFTGRYPRVERLPK